MQEQSATLSQILSIYDALLTPFYFLLLLFIVYRWKKRHYSDSPIGKYLLPAFIFRMVCCVLLALIYQFYYRYGDPFNYYSGASEIWNATKASPSYGLELVFKPYQECSSNALKFATHLTYPQFSPDLVRMFRVCGFMGMFCFGTYLPIAMMISFLSLIGSWRIFLVFYKEFPAYHRIFAIICFFLPSTAFWSTNLLKDPFCILGIGLCFSGLYHFIRGGFGFKQLLEVVLGVIILLSFKSYILVITCVVAVYCIYAGVIKTMGRSFLKFIVTTAIFLLIATTAIWAFLSSDYISTMVTDNFIGPIQVLQDGQLDPNVSGSSAYILPNATDNSIFGIIRSYFLSLNVALFRPYLWEIPGFLGIINTLEATVIFFITFYLLIKLRKGFFVPAFKNPLLLFSLLFTLLLAPLVGFVAFNFGTLARYKIPFVPFFYCYLAIVYNQTKPTPQTSLS